MSLEIKILPKNNMKKILVALSVCAVFSFAGCIDRSFELTEVSGEMTVGGEELTVPLADISTVSASCLSPSRLRAAPWWARTWARKSTSAYLRS